MYPAPFEYLRAESYDEAIALLVDHGEDAKLLAGGQSLLPMMHLRLARPAVLIDINGIGHGARPELRDGWLHLPALTRQRALERLPEVIKHAPLFTKAAGHVGNVRVRTRGTLGGNLAHADPSSELGCAAVAAGAIVEVAGPGGLRDVPITELFISDLTTSLAPAEVIRGVRVRVRGAGTGYGFSELAFRAGEFAIVNSAGMISLDRRGRCSEVRLACGGVGARIFDASSIAAEQLAGNEPTPERVAEAARAVAAQCTPRDDHQASAAYRVRMTEVFARRTLTAAVTNAVEREHG